MTPLQDFAQTVQDSWPGAALAESVYAFPIVEGAHLIGLALSLGMILFVDLRLVGVFLKQVPVIDVLRPLRGWLLAGYALTLGTGVLLFASEATKLVGLPVFWLKLALIALAGLNAAWFEWKWGKGAADWGSAATLPRGVRLAGWASLSLWVAVASCGRLIPYLGAGL